MAQKYIILVSANSCHKCTVTNYYNASVRPKCLLHPITFFRESDYHLTKSTPVIVSAL